MTLEQAFTVLGHDLTALGLGVHRQIDEDGVPLVRFSHNGNVIGSVSVPQRITEMSDDEGLTLLADLLRESVHAARNEPARK
jgi:hypothetical protein